MKVMDSPASVELFARQITEISSLPDTAVKIIETVQNANAGASDLMRVLQSDPSLTARVLRTVNSAAFGLSEKVRDLHKAISFLGFTQIRNLALTASISNIFKEGEQISSYTRPGLWRHMVSVGIGARMIARRVELPNPEEAFLCGLLHDIGIILIDQYAHEQFREVLSQVEARADAFLCDVEREVLGFDHAELAAHVLRGWRFPPLLENCILLHHERNLRNAQEPLIVQCVQAANIICTLSGVASVGRKALQCSADVFRELGFGKTDVKVLATDLGENLEQQKALFELI